MRHWIAAATLACLAPQAQAATSVLLDLNDFFADPSVTISPDGSSATLTEDSTLGIVLLSNIPFLGDPAIISGATGRTLSLDYAFIETGTDADDEFGVSLLDSAGAFLGAPFEAFFDSSASGSLSFDLSGFVGQTLGLQFQLSALFSDFSYDSTVTISNLRLTDSTAIVPLPPAGLLLIAGLAGFYGFRRKQLA